MIIVKSKSKHGIEEYRVKREEALEKMQWEREREREKKRDRGREIGKERERARER